MKNKKSILGLIAASTAIGSQVVYSPEVMAQESANYMPKITGQAQVLELNSSSFQPLKGIKATDFDGKDISDKIVTYGSVNTTVVGKQTVTYSVTNEKGYTAILSLEHEVKDMDKPLLQERNKMVFYMSEYDKRPNIDRNYFFLAQDASDKNIQSSLKVQENIDFSKAGTYSVTATVTDMSNNSTTINASAQVIDNVKPVIQTKDLYIKAFSEVDLKTAIISAYDNNDGQLDINKIVIKGLDNFDNKISGVYTLFAEIEDSSGNIGVSEFRVNVLENSNPVITGPEKITVLQGESVDIASKMNYSDPDNDKVSLKILNEEILDVNTLGSYNLKLIATDEHGNQSEEFILTVEVVSATSKVNIITNTDEMPNYTVEVKRGSFVTLPTLTKKYHKFEGWYLDPNFTVAYDNGKVESDISLYAKWSRQENYINISFDPNNGEKTQVYTIEQGVENKLSPGTPKKEGYVFEGWFSDDIEFSPSAMYDKDTVFVAKYVKDRPQEIVHSVVFEPKNGKDATIVEVKDGYTVQAIEEPVRLGYIFMGWYYEGEKYNFVSPVVKDITLEAKWEPVKEKYTVVFLPDNGLAETKLVREEGQSVGYTPQTPFKEGYRFLGWYVDDMFYNPNMIVNKNLVVKAKWEKLPTVKTYIVSFSPQNGESSFARNIREGYTIGHVNDPVRDGYKFLGWYSSTGEKYSPSLVVNSNMLFTARWELIDIPEKPYPEPEKPEPEKPKPERPEEPKEDEIEFAIDSFDLENVVGFSTNIFGQGGIFEGYLNVNNNSQRFDAPTLRKYGFRVSMPQGVRYNGNQATFSQPGTYTFTVSGNGRTVSATVIIRSEAKKPNPSVFITLQGGKLDMFAGQSFNPLAHVDVKNGSKDLIAYDILDSNGNSANVNLSSMPFGKYFVVYSINKGNSETLELTVVSAPTKTEGNKPSLLVKDRIVAEEGQELILKELATAVDIDGNSLTDEIIIESDVNWNKAGSYEVKFKVTDFEGRTTEKISTVEVLEKEKYENEISRSKAQSAKQQGVKVATSDMSLAASYSNLNVLIFGTSAGMGLLIKRKKE